MEHDGSTFTAGFYLGNLAYLGVVALAFWFAGRWGWIGMLIRIVCGPVPWRVVQLVAFIAGQADFASARACGFSGGPAKCALANDQRAQMAPNRAFRSFVPDWRTHAESQLGGGGGS